LSASTQDLKKPQFVYRPPPLPPNGEELMTRLRKRDPELDLKSESFVMLEVFKRLGAEDLGRCACVCKAWNKIVQVKGYLHCHATEKSEAIACARRCRLSRLRGGWKRKEELDKNGGLRSRTGTRGR
jgi:hypothetical protein